MEITRFIVTAVDVGDTCDGKARVLGAFKTEDEAKNYVKNDMQEYADERTYTDEETGKTIPCFCDFDKMFAGDDYNNCSWNIESITFEE